MYIYLDTETTGNGPDDRLCQIAFKPEDGPAVSGLFNPGKPISIDAMVVHHITVQVRAVRDVLIHTLGWDVSNVEYILYFDNEEWTLADIDEADRAIIDQDKKPNCMSALFQTDKPMMSIDLVTCDPEMIIIEVDTIDSPPYPILNALENILSLVPFSDKIPINSAFLAHAFDNESDQYANEIARFLNLSGIITQSGREYSPGSVSEKVRKLLSKHDIIFVIVTANAEKSWLIQEMTAAEFRDKPIFILKQEEATFKLGLLGDKEYIPFPKGQISRTFIPILEGLQGLKKTEFV